MTDYRMKSELVAEELCEKHDAVPIEETRCGSCATRAKHMKVALEEAHENGRREENEACQSISQERHTHYATCMEGADGDYFMEAESAATACWSITNKIRARMEKT